MTEADTRVETISGYQWEAGGREGKTECERSIERVRTGARKTKRESLSKSGRNEERKE